MADNIDTQNQSPGGGYFDWSTFSRNLQNNQEQALINQRYNNAIGNMISIYGPNAGAPQSWQTNIQNSILPQTLQSEIGLRNAQANLGNSNAANVTAGIPGTAASSQIMQQRAMLGQGGADVASTLSGANLNNANASNAAVTAARKTSGADTAQPVFVDDGQGHMVRAIGTVDSQGNLVYHLPTMAGSKPTGPSAPAGTPGVNAPVVPPPRNPGDQMIQEGKLSDGTPVATYRDSQGNMYHSGAQPTNYGAANPGAGPNVQASQPQPTPQPVPQGISPDQIKMGADGTGTILMPSAGGLSVQPIMTPIARAQAVEKQTATVQAAASQYNNMRNLEAQFKPWVQPTGKGFTNQFDVLDKLIDQMPNNTFLRNESGVTMIAGNPAARQFEEAAKGLTGLVQGQHMLSASAAGEKGLRAMSGLLNAAENSYLTTGIAQPKAYLHQQINDARNSIGTMYNGYHSDLANAANTWKSANITLKQIQSVGGTAPITPHVGATNGRSSSASPYHNWH